MSTPRSISSDGSPTGTIVPIVVEDWIGPTDVRPDFHRYLSLEEQKGFAEKEQPYAEGCMLAVDIPTRQIYAVKGALALKENYTDTGDPFVKVWLLIRSSRTVISGCRKFEITDPMFFEGQAPPTPAEIQDRVRRCGYTPSVLHALEPSHDVLKFNASPNVPFLLEWCSVPAPVADRAMVPALSAPSLESQPQQLYPVNQQGFLTPSSPVKPEALFCGRGRLEEEPDLLPKRRRTGEKYQVLTQIAQRQHFGYLGMIVRPLPPEMNSRGPLRRSWKCS